MLQVDNNVLITKFFFQNVTPQMLALNHLHTRQEVYGINYQTVLEHVSHWKILRQRLSLGQLTMTCDIYILPCILGYLVFVDLTCFRFYMCCCLYLFLNLIYYYSCFYPFLKSLLLLLSG